ncbi:MAG: hypothetical protein HBSAPP04_25460 [Ignavibacteriaceae bacterium]|nr:MAG: hypothetical protein HBSAPP04_25460 [Ignavibacteriaceae bacterium]
MIAEAKALVAGLIEDAIKLLENPADQLKVYQPASLEAYEDLDDGGHILVLYGGSKFDENKVAYGVQQNREITITIVIESLNTPGRMAPEDYLDLVIAALISADVTEEWRQAGRRITIQSDELTDERNGRWRYVMDVTVPGLIYGGGTI